MRICSKCGGGVEPIYEKRGYRCRTCISKALAEWGRNNRDKTCAASARWRAAHPEQMRAKGRLSNWKRIGISFTLEEYDAMLAGQNGKCAICHTDKPGGHGGRKGTFHVDHDHESGRVRGLLCYRCNRGIGLFADDPDLLRSVAQYLDSHRPHLRLAP